MATPIESIATLNDALNGVPFSFAFLGGSVLSLLVTDKSAEYLKAPELEDAVDGFVQTEPDPPKRRAAIIERFQSVAALVQMSST